MAPRPLIVRFSPATASLLEAVARVRLAVKQRREVESLLIDVSTDEWKGTLAGVRSEYAVAEALGAEVDPAILSQIWDAGIDLRVRGCSLQVKYSEHRNARFALPAYERHLKADYGVLVTAGPDPLSVVIVGQISRARFAEHAERIVLQSGEQLAVQQALLEPLERIA